MNRKLPISKMDIVLFPRPKSSQCTLRHKINFLNYIKAPKPFKFASITENAHLINNLSLKENILLNTVSITEFSNSSFCLTNYIESTGNVFLAQLYNKITLPHEVPLNVDIQTRKLAALVKAILSYSNYILLDNPEKYISFKNMDLFFQALQFKMTAEGQTILVSSENELYWRNYATHSVALENSGYNITPLKRSPELDGLVNQDNRPSSGQFIVTDETEGSDGLLSINTSLQKNKSAA